MSLPCILLHCPRKGKPSDSEWSLLAAFVLEHRPAGDEPQASHHLRVVALGTGNRCLGDTDRRPGGTLVNDSHAEVIARRSLRRFLCAELAKPSGLSDVLEEVPAPGGGGRMAGYKEEPCGSFLYQPL